MTVGRLTNSEGQGRCAVGDGTRPDTNISTKPPIRQRGSSRRAGRSAKLRHKPPPAPRSRPQRRAAGPSAAHWPATQPIIKQIPITQRSARRQRRRRHCGRLARQMLSLFLSVMPTPETRTLPRRAARPAACAPPIAAAISATKRTISHGGRGRLATRAGTASAGGGREGRRRRPHHRQDARGRARAD